MMDTGTTGPFWATSSNQPRLGLGVLIIPAWPIPLTVLCTFGFLSINRQYRETILATTRRLLPWLLTSMRLLSFCRVGYDMTAKLRRDGSWMDVITLEFLAAALEYGFIQQRDLTACILLALGWLTLWKPMPIDADYTTERMVAVHISTALFFGVLPLERRHITLAISGASLLVIALASPAAIHNGLPWSAMPLIGALFVRMSASGLQLLGSDPQFRERTAVHGFRRAVFGLLALTNIIFGGILVSGWLWSCYGWTLLRMQPDHSQPPGLTLGSICGGGAPFVGTLLLLMHMDQMHDRWIAEREHTLLSLARRWMAFAAKAVAWTTCGHGVVYAILYAMR